MNVGAASPLLEVRNLAMHFPVTEGIVRVDHDGTHATLFAGERIEVDAHVHPVEKTSPAKLVARDDEVAPLLQAADDARATGHPEDALAPLRKIIAEHAGDSRAGLVCTCSGVRTFTVEATCDASVGVRVAVTITLDSMSEPGSSCASSDAV